MRVKQSTAVILCWAVLAGTCARAADTLYPISSSDSNKSLPETVGSRSYGTNKVATIGAISVTMKPTAIAPPGANGAVQVNGRTLKLHVAHLGPGTYDLKFVRRSDQLSEPLGTITIEDPTLGPDRQANDNRKEASAHPESALIQSDSQMTLPFELASKEIARFVLLAPGGNAVLVGEVK